jgi:hypothetical protein
MSVIEWPVGARRLGPAGEHFFHEGCRGIYAADVGGLVAG